MKSENAPRKHDQKRALILVDIQNDFLPGGALAVARGDEVILVANRLAQSDLFDLVIATQDFHPANHQSFASNNPGRKPGEMGELAGLPQVMWPNHCVQGTTGAEFAAKLDQSRISKVFRKGLDPKIDSYSGFFDNGKRHSTGLGEYLRKEGVGEVVVLGLATDYCVKFTAVDASELGFKTILVVDGSRAVNLSSGDGDKAVKDMEQAGIKTVTSAKLLTEQT